MTENPAGPSRGWRNLPLASRLALMTSLLVVVVVAALTYWTVQLEQSTFRRELKSEADLLLDTLPRTIRDPLYFLEVDELQDVANVVYQNEEITLVRIYDREGKLLIDAESGMPAFSRTPDPLGLTLVGLGPAGTYEEWQEEQLLVGRGAYLGNQQVGAVALGLSTSDLQAEIEALAVQSLLIAGATLLIGIIAAFTFARQITTPLSELTAVAVDMAGGDLSKRTSQADGAEIGQLSHAFNQMAESIQRRENDLRDLAAGLEQAVKDRTRELQSRNVELQGKNEELTIARKEAEEANRLKSQFLATMSHELRTPLNAVIGFSQLLSAGTSGDLNTKQLEKVVRIHKNAETLLEMINDLLDLSKIEAGRLEILQRPFAPRPWIDEILVQIGGLAEQRKLDLTLHYDPAMPSFILGDPIRLKQIASNLITNAIKFTEKGGVTVSIHPSEESTWTLEVTDTGIGIAPHAQDYIFDAFRQVDGSSNRKVGGTGLGLAIVRNLIVLMKGSIKLKSEPAKGSTFTVTLPLVVVKNTEKIEEQGKQA
jgi:signal transduction histidine kinase